MEPAEHERAKAHRPEAVGNFVERDVFLREDMTHVYPVIVPAHAAVVTDPPHFALGWILEPRQPRRIAARGHDVLRSRGVLAERLMRTFGRLLLLPLLVACHARAPVDHEVWQELIPVASLPTDSAVLARLQQQHACVATLPPLQATADTLAANHRCTLVMTAVAAIRDLNAAADIVPDLRRFRLDQVRCVAVRAEAYRNGVTQAIELPRWIVDFSSDRQPSLTVDIDRRTGDARVYRQLNESGFTAADICARAS